MGDGSTSSFPPRSATWAEHAWTTTIPTGPARRPSPWSQVRPGVYRYSVHHFSWKPRRSARPRTRSSSAWSWAPAGPHLPAAVERCFGGQNNVWVVFTFDGVTVKPSIPSTPQSASDVREWASGPESEDADLWQDCRPSRRSRTWRIAGDRVGKPHARRGGAARGRARKRRGSAHPGVPSGHRGDRPRVPFRLKHPEVIIQSIQGMQERQRVTGEQQAAQKLAARQDDLLRDASAPVGGTPAGDLPWWSSSTTGAPTAGRSRTP